MKVEARVDFNRPCLPAEYEEEMGLILVAIGAKTEEWSKAKQGSDYIRVVKAVQGWGPYRWLVEVGEETTPQIADERSGAEGWRRYYLAHTTGQVDVNDPPDTAEEPSDASVTEADNKLFEQIRGAPDSSLIIGRE